MRNWQLAGVLASVLLLGSPNLSATQVQMGAVGLSEMANGTIIGPGGVSNQYAFDALVFVGSYLDTQINPTQTLSEYLTANFGAENSGSIAFNLPTYGVSGTMAYTGGVPVLFFTGAGVGITTGSYILTSLAGSSAVISAIGNTLLNINPLDPASLIGALYGGGAIAGLPPGTVTDGGDNSGQTVQHINQTNGDNNYIGTAWAQSDLVSAAIRTPNTAPEPATLVLIAVGLASLGYSRRRRLT